MVALRPQLHHWTPICQGGNTPSVNLRCPSFFELCLGDRWTDLGACGALGTQLGITVVVRNLSTHCGAYRGVGCCGNRRIRPGCSGRGPLGRCPTTASGSPPPARPSESGVRFGTTCKSSPYQRFLGTGHLPPLGPTASPGNKWGRNIKSRNPQFFLFF